MGERSGTVTFPKSKMAAAMRSLDIRWIRRYRLFFIFGSIILSIQVFLAYKFFSIDSSDNSNNGLEHFEATGKQRIGVGLVFEVSVIFINKSGFYTYF